MDEKPLGHLVGWELGRRRGTGQPFQTLAADAEKRKDGILKQRGGGRERRPVLASVGENWRIPLGHQLWTPCKGVPLGLASVGLPTSRLEMRSPLLKWTPECMKGY